MNATTIKTAEGIEQYVVNTVPPSELPNGTILVRSDLRKSATKAPTEAEKHRSIAIVAPSTDGVPSKFASLLQEKLAEIATAKFTAAMEATNRLATTVPVSDYTVDALLQFAAVQSESRRLSSETIGNWFDSSATLKGLQAAGKNEKQQATWKAMLSKLASPNSGITKEVATMLLAGIAEADVEAEEPAGTIAQQLTSRLQAIINRKEENLLEML